jgi:predicted NBD/HSP70 family sugar kinase
MGIASLINIFEPDSVVLSGGMAKFVNYDELSKKVRDRVVLAEVNLIPAKFENFAGILGAAYLAREKFSI